MLANIIISVFIRQASTDSAFADKITIPIICKFSDSYGSNVSCSIDCLLLLLLPVLVTCTGTRALSLSIFTSCLLSFKRLYRNGSTVLYRSRKLSQCFVSVQMSLQTNPLRRFYQSCQRLARCCSRLASIRK